MPWHMYTVSLFGCTWHTYGNILWRHESGCPCEDSTDSTAKSIQQSVSQEHTPQFRTDSCQIWFFVWFDSVSMKRGPQNHMFWYINLAARLTRHLKSLGLGIVYSNCTAITIIAISLQKTSPSDRKGRSQAKVRYVSTEGCYGVIQVFNW